MRGEQAMGTSFNCCGHKNPAGEQSNILFFLDTMKLAVAFTFLVTAYTVEAWSSSSQKPQRHSLPPSTPLPSPSSSSRRALLQRVATMVTVSTAAITGMTTTPPTSWAGLLDDYGSDPSKIQSTTSVDTITPTSKQKEASVIEPNLRSNYYYPTNKKRYLPRIKRCSDAIPDVAASIGSQDWTAVETFATKIADDTVLPMRLYTSSLTGGGTNVKVSYTKDMNKCADEFEKNQKKLLVALRQQDQQGSSEALERMATALLTYRTVGRLLGPDGGGDIPSTDEIRRAACRVQGRSFSKTIQARDARVGS